MKEFDTLKFLMERDRSIRRFVENKEVEPEIVKKIIELTTYCSSGRNLQPLKYRLVLTAEERESIFPLLAWAGYFTDWNGPQKGERPAAYIVQCLDTRLTKNCLCDEGLQLQAITLGATSLELGCCIIKAFNAKELKKILNLPEYLEPSYVVAMGYPAENVELEKTDGRLEADIKYYRTSDGVHHVPKRPLKEILL